MTRSVRRGEVDDDADRCDDLKLKPANAKPMDFNQATQRRRRPHQEATRTVIQLDAIVTDKPGEGQQASRCCIDQVPGQQRFAGTGWPPDEDCLWSGKNG